MPDGMDPALTKTLIEAEGDVARHGVVIVRTIEMELSPALMAAARDSIESSPRKLATLSEEDLDDLMQSLRKSATKSARDLGRLLTRVLSKLGNEDILELECDLEGVDQLFKWQKIAKTAEPVSEILTGQGFPPIELSGPDDIADNLRLELDEKWQNAFSRFSEAVKNLAAEIRTKEATSSASGRKRKKSEGR